MYSIKAIFEKTPAEIATGIRLLLLLAIAVGFVNAIDQQTLGIIGLAIEGLLGLFLIRATTSAKAPVVERDTEVAIKGSTDTVIARPTPPGPIGIPDGQLVDPPFGGDAPTGPGVG